MAQVELITKSVIRSYAMEAAADFRTEFPGETFDPAQSDWEATWLEMDDRDDVREIRYRPKALALFGRYLAELTKVVTKVVMIWDIGTLEEQYRAIYRAAARLEFDGIEQSEVAVLNAIGDALVDIVMLLEDTGEAIIVADGSVGRKV